MNAVVLQAQALRGMKDLSQIPSTSGTQSSGNAPSQEEGGGRATVNAASTQWMPTAEQPKPVSAAIKQKLTAALEPVSLLVTDDSSSHAGHAGSKATNSPSGETHFKARP